MPPRSSGAQELGAQLQEQVESLRSTSSAAASRAERSLRAELAEARAEAALLRHELLQAEEAHAAAVAKLKASHEAKLNEVASKVEKKMKKVERERAATAEKHAAELKALRDARPPPSPTRGNV